MKHKHFHFLSLFVEGLLQISIDGESTRQRECIKVLA
jgi:hypothetical protein